MNKEQKNKAHNSISRAERARQVMQDPMLKEALTAMKADNYNKFMNTAFDQHEERDELWRKAQTMQKFEVYLESVMTDGKISQLTLDKLK